MNKSFIYLLVIVLLVISAAAASPKVMVLKLNYDNGNISLVNKTIKYGFGPDRRYQPDYGYRLEIISFDNNQLYEFRFKAPNEMFVDGTDANGEISGGKIVLDNVNFALNVPYYNDMKEIRVYSPSGEISGSFSFEEERKVSIIKWVIIGLIAIITLILIAWIYIKNSRQ